MKRIIQKTNIVRTIALIVTFLSPGIVSAQNTNLLAVTDEATRFIQGLILIVIGAGLLVFLWGVLRLAFTKEASDRKKAITFMVWGLIALFVMVSVWGLVFVLRQALGLDKDDGSAPEDIPRDIPATEGVVSAQGDGPLYEAIAAVGNVIQDIIPIIILAAVLVFLWGVFRYVLSTSSERRAEGTKYMTWGLIGITIMAFVWAFVAMLRDFFGIRDGEAYGDQIAGELPDQDGGSFGRGADSIPAVVEQILALIQQILPVLVLLGALFFIWGVFNYIRTENINKKAQASAYIAWGIGILFVLVSAWGLVYAIAQTLGLEGKLGETVNSTEQIDVNSLIKK